MNKLKILLLITFLLIPQGVSAENQTMRDNDISASISLHRERINVIVGEEIVLKLSVVNLITKPTMNAQVIIKPPSGMSVTSTEFTQGAAGQFTSTYRLNPGDTRDIEIRLKANEEGSFIVEGWVIYYFGEDLSSKEVKILKEPITVSSKVNLNKPEPTKDPTPTEIYINQQESTQLQNTQFQNITEVSNDIVSMVTDIVPIMITISIISLIVGVFSAITTLLRGNL